jgi:hypothetical protein
MTDTTWQERHDTYTAARAALTDVVGRIEPYWQANTAVPRQLLEEFDEAHMAEQAAAEAYRAGFLNE